MSGQVNPASIKVKVWSDKKNAFVLTPMTKIVCPECGAKFDTAGDDGEGMVWYDANRRSPEAGECWVVECPCGEQFTDMDTEV